MTNPYTIEQLILSRRGRGNIISYCHESTWNLPETERQEKNSGEIYFETMKMPKDIRQRPFDWCRETYDLMDKYAREKAKETIFLLNPDLNMNDNLKVFMEIRRSLRNSQQLDINVEKVRREYIFASAVNAFLRHL